MLVFLSGCAEEGILMLTAEDRPRGNALVSTEQAFRCKSAIGPSSARCWIVAHFARFVVVVRG